MSIKGIDRIGWIVFLTTVAPLGLEAGQAASHYIYLSDQRIAIVELVDPQSAILNYFNLSDSIEYLRAPYLVVFDVQGGPYRGHVIEVEAPSEPSERYQVNHLIKPREFVGLTILGQFDFQGPPVRAYFRIGSRILELEALTPADFETVAARVGELDLSMGDTKALLEFAGFRRGHGQMHRIGEESGDRLAQVFPDVELLAPLVINGPKPKLPASERKRPDPVVVQISAAVGRSGNLYNLEVKQGLNRRLDDLAIEIVRNSWRLLPAISNGRIADSETTLNVVFER